MRAWLRSRRVDLILAGVYLLVCAALDHFHFSPIDIDSHSYLNLAKGIAERGEFKLAEDSGRYVSTFTRTPGYPGFLAVLSVFGGATVSVAIWLQRLGWAWLIACFLPAVGALGNPSTRWPAGIAKALALFLPLSVVTTSTVLAETLYTILTVVGIWLLCGSWNMGRAAAAGLLLGVATLVRPVGLWVPMLACGTLGFVRLLGSIAKLDRRGLASLLIALFIGLGIPAVWMWHVKAIAGRFALTSLNGPTFALNRQQVIEGLDPGAVRKLPTTQQIYVNLVKREKDVYWAVVLLRRELKLDEFSANDVAEEVARYAVLSEPGDYLRTISMNLTRTFCSATEGLQLFATLSGRLEIKDEIWRIARERSDWVVMIAHLLLRGIQPVFLLLVPAYLLWRYRHELSRDELTVALVVCAGYLVLAPALLTVSYGRFLFPALPAIVCVYALPRWRNSVSVKGPIGNARDVADSIG